MKNMFKTNDWRMNEKELANGFSLSLGEFARNKSKRDIETRSRRERTGIERDMKLQQPGNLHFAA